jgi:cytidyltransferase-like protein
LEDGHAHGLRGDERRLRLRGMLHFFWAVGSAGLDPARVSRHPSGMAEPRKIALFGGTFDPVHRGHIHLAEIAREKLHLDEVRFLPCRISPHKLDFEPSSAADRLEMLRLATENLPWAVVDDFEIRREGPSYSWQTAEAMAEKFPGARLFWIMGGDQWRALRDHVHDSCDCGSFHRPWPVCQSMSVSTKSERLPVCRLETPAARQDRRSRDMKANCPSAHFQEPASRATTAVVGRHCRA